MKIENLQLILKTVERCNIACTYCYYFFGGDDSYKERPSVMKIAVIDEIVKYIEESYSYYKFKNVWISLHGGEPMLQSIDSVYSMCSKLAQLKSIGINVIFSIQTNGTLINDEWISLFEKYDFSVGVSIDGPKSINDQYRIDKKGRSTYERLESGIFKLNEAVRLGRIQDVSSISVINPKFCYKKIFNHLTEILKIKNINFLLPDVSYERGLPEGTTAEDFGRVLLEIFHQWVGKEQVNVRYIKESLKNFQVYRYSNDSFFEQIKKFQIVVIHSDGETSPDDSLIPAISWYKDEGKEKLNVSSSSLVDFLQSNKLAEIDHLYSTIPSGCKLCSYVKICKGGDLENRYSKENGFDNPSIFCAGLKIYYGGVISWLRNNGYPENLIKEVLS